MDDTPLGRLIDRLADMAAKSPDLADATALDVAVDLLDAYRILYGDITARPGDHPRGILKDTRSLPERPAQPVPNRRQRRKAITVRRYL